MNQLSLNTITVDYATEKVSVSDYFIDQYSLQEQLKDDYKEAFAQGRFKEFLVPVLGREFSDKLDFQEDSMSTRLPDDNESLITPIYGCHDNCCIYVFAEVSRQEDFVYWNTIGRNKMYLKNDESTSNIDWLPHFKPLKFNISNYKTIINTINSNQ